MEIRQSWRRAHVILVLLLMTLLTSCTHVSRKDGPPNFYVDESKIPNAVPKAEPRAKFGNMTSYRVFGKRYYVMKSSKRYDQVGTASWYGSKFHAQRTSSGEPYNMLAMTAAHKSLPLPTYVEVTNLKNKRKIIVKVNDRGPFASNRIIDLSYVAAKKLGMIGHGTTYVRVKAIDPNTYGKNIIVAQKQKHYSHEKISTLRFVNHSKTTLQVPKKGIYIQAGAFRNKSYADKLKSRLMAKFDTPINVAHPASGNKLYRVQIGPVQDVATAKEIRQQLKLMGTS